MKKGSFDLLAYDQGFFQIIRRSHSLAFLSPSSPEGRREQKREFASAQARDTRYGFFLLVEILIAFLPPSRIVFLAFSQSGFSVRKTRVSLLFFLSSFHFVLISRISSSSSSINVLLTRTLGAHRIYYSVSTVSFLFAISCSRIFSQNLAKVIALAFTTSNNSTLATRM